VAKAPVDEVMVFNVGETKLALTHRKLLTDQHFCDFELHLGGAHKKNPPARVHRAILQLRCPNLLQEGKFISKIERTKKDHHFSAVVSETALPCMTPAVLQQLMTYVYSGTMEVSRFSLATVLDMGAVSSALDMKEVLWLCEHKVLTYYSFLLSAFSFLYSVVLIAHSLLGAGAVKYGVDPCDSEGGKRSQVGVGIQLCARVRV
jgi:hypothetical protein